MVGPNVVDDTEGMSEEEYWRGLERQDKICKGELCPNCGSTNIKCAGSVPDGFNMNYAYDCLNCGEQWEGY